MIVAKKWTVVIALIVVVFPTGLFLASYLGRQSSITLTPDEFQPVRLNGVKFNVYDGDSGVLIKTIDPSSGVKYYLDPTHKYPKVDVFYSQPFNSDRFGNAIEASHVPATKLIVNGEVFFLTSYYLAIDVGARTYANLPTPRTSSIVLSPWKGFTYTYMSPVFGQMGTITLGTNIGDTHTYGELDGQLCVFMDVGVSPWTPTYGGGTAQITASLEQIDFQFNTWNAPVRAGYSFEDAVTKCKTEYGNNPVVVQPSIDIQAMSNAVSYSYTQTGILPNGSSATITVDTTSAKVGFADVYQSQIDQFGYVGLIPNTFSNQFNDLKMPITTPTEGPSNQVTVDQKNLFVKEVTIKGWITNLQDAAQRVITGGAATHGFSSTLPTIPLTINLANYALTTLPEQLQITPEFSLQPKTTVNIARTEVGYSAWFFDGSIVGSVDMKDDKFLPSPKIIQYPYAINIENVYAASRIVMKLQVVTQNEIGIIMANGKAVDPKRLVDFDLTSIIRDPKQDDMKSGVSKDIIDWQSIIITAIVIVTVIIVTTMIFSFLAKIGIGASKGPQKKTSKRISFGTKGVEYESSSG